MASERVFKHLGLALAGMVFAVAASAQTVPVITTSVFSGDPAAPNATFQVLVTVSDSPSTGSVESLMFKVMYDSRKAVLTGAEWVNGAFGGLLDTQPVVLTPSDKAPVQAPADPSLDAFRHVAAADIAGTNTLTNGPLLLLTFETLAWPSEPLNIQLGNPGAVYQAKDAEAPLVYQLLGDDGDLRPEYAPIFDNLATIPIGAKDVDHDRIPDFAEALFPTASETNVYIADSDGDGVLDADEIDLSLSPRIRDTDGDGLWDGYELWLGTDPVGVQNEVTDADNDGLPEAVNDDVGSPLDLAAILGGADPDAGNVDTDGDGFADGYDALVFLSAAAANDDTLVPNLGDVNNIGGINPTDALICLSLFIQNITLEHPAIVNDQAFDVNRDGQINPTDALIMLRRFGGFSNAAVLPIPIK